MSLINKALSELNDTPPEEPDKNQQSQFINTSIFVNKNTKHNSTIIAAVCIALLLTSTTLTIILIKKHQQMTAPQVHLTQHTSNTPRHNLLDKKKHPQSITAPAQKSIAPAPVKPAGNIKQAIPIVSINHKTAAPARQISSTYEKKATPQLKPTHKTKQASPVVNMINKELTLGQKTDSTSPHNTPPTPKTIARRTDASKPVNHFKKSDKAQASTLKKKPKNVTAASNNIVQPATMKAKESSTKKNAIAKPRLQEKTIIANQIIANKTNNIDLTIKDKNKIAPSITTNEIEIAPAEKMQDTIQANTSKTYLHLYKNLIQKITNNPSIDISTELSNPSLQQQLTTHQMSMIASRLIENNQIQQANEFLAMDIETYSQSIALSQLYAKTLFLNNQFVQALAVLSNLSPTFYNHPDYYSLMASIYLKLHQTLLASQIYHHLVQIQPNTFQYWLGLAIANQRLSNTDIAIDAYQHTLSLTPIDGNIAKFSRQQLYRLQKNI